MFSGVFGSASGASSSEAKKNDRFAKGLDVLSSSPEMPTFTVKDMLGTLGISPSSSSLHPPSTSLEYLFDDESLDQGPSFGSRLAYGTGITYFSGLAFGGLWGLGEGILHPGAKTAKLRWNCVLNACTRRGPFVGNHLGLVALFYNFIHGGFLKAANRPSDLLSSVSSAFLAGALFRSPAGPKSAAIAGLVTGSAMAAFDIIRNLDSYSSYLRAKYDRLQK